jgi:hypothetical protein
MQVEIRVKVRRCYLSRALGAQAYYRSRRKAGFSQQLQSSKAFTSFFIPSFFIPSFLSHLRKGLVEFASDPQAVQHHG